MVGEFGRGVCIRVLYEVRILMRELGEILLFEAAVAERVD
jgi:hypothetical protein